MSIRFIVGASAAYATVTAVEVAASILTLPILTRHLSLRDYGAMLSIANGTASINLLLGYSLAQALPTLYAAATTEEQKSRATATVMAASLAVSVPVHLAVGTWSEPISMMLFAASDYATAVRAGALASFLVSTSLCLTWILRMRELHWTYFRVQLPAVLIQLGVLLALLLGAGLGLISLYLAMCAAGLWTMSAYAWTVRSSLTAPIDRTMLGKAFRIAVNMLPWQIATLLTTSSAGFILARAGRLEEAGLLAIAMSAAMLLVSLSNAFGQVWTPFVLNRPSADGLAATQQRMFSLYSAGLLVLASGLALFSREIFAVLAAPKFQAGFHFVPPLAAAFALFCFANTFAQGLQARQRTGHYAWIGLLISLAFVATAALLVGRYGAYGVIAAMGAGFLTMLVMLQLVSRRLMPVDYPWARHILMWAAAAVLVWHVYPLGLSFAALSVKSAALLAVAASTLLFGAVGVADLRAARELITSARRA